MTVRRWAIAATGVAGAVLVAAAAAWACVSGPAINLSTVNAKPGQEISVTGTNFSSSNRDPVQVRWNALDGPVIADLGAPSSGSLNGKFTVPADAKPGNYVVIFLQGSADGKLSTIPIRSLVTVTPDTGANPVLGAPLATPQAERPSGLVTSDNSIGGGTLVLVALGVAGVGMFVAGMAALFAGRRTSAAT
ncbi:MAG TPA: hypothetical protein VJ739_16075, partial [Gemmataceae bacterium]|nr:hypothetical protein [Gemmataceae bacterium]